MQGVIKSVALITVLTICASALPVLADASIPSNNKWIVLTTINAPTSSVVRAAAEGNWSMVVVADLKSKATYEVPGCRPSRCVYLTPETQDSMTSELKSASLLPHNHYARKNIGFLYAVKHGAKVIFDLDDDNRLLPDVDLSATAAPLFGPHADGGSPMGPVLVAASHSGHICADRSAKAGGGWNGGHDCSALINPYVHFGQRSIWPRGMPLECVSDVSSEIVYVGAAESMGGPLGECGGNAGQPAVLQSVVDGDPDVDAIFRLTRRASGRRIDVPFDRTAPPLVLPQGRLSPWNSQATMHAYDGFFALALPVSVPFRVTDIWRSYFAQRMLWEVGRTVGFLPPLVRSVRNAHDNMADFRDEQMLYDKSLALVGFLLKWEAPVDAKDVGEAAVALANAMKEAEFWGTGDVGSIEAFIADLRTIGYSFPAMVTRESASHASKAQEHTKSVVHAPKLAVSLTRPHLAPQTKGQHCTQAPAFHSAIQWFRSKHGAGAFPTSTLSHVLEMGLPVLGDDTEGNCRSSLGIDVGQGSHQQVMEAFAKDGDFVMEDGYLGGEPGNTVLTEAVRQEVAPDSAERVATDATRDGFVARLQSADPWRDVLLHQEDFMARTVTEPDADAVPEQTPILTYTPYRHRASIFELEKRTSPQMTRHVQDKSIGQFGKAASSLLPALQVAKRQAEEQGETRTKLEGWLHPSSCDTAAIALHPQNPKHDIAGLGAHMNSIMQTFFKDRRQSMTPILYQENLGPYAQKAICPSGSISCYLGGISGCSTGVADYVSGAKKPAHLSGLTWFSYGQLPSTGEVRAKGDVLGNVNLSTSHLFYSSELLRVLSMQPWIRQLRAGLARSVGLHRGKPYAALAYRSDKIKKSETPRQPMDQHVRALSSAWHAYGKVGTTVLVESDDGAAIDGFKAAMPGVDFVQIPRCLFQSLKGRNNEYIMDLLKRKQAESARDGKDLSGAQGWTQEQLTGCPALEHLPPHDETSLLLATMDLLGGGYPLVCSMSSNLCRLAGSYAAQRQFPPAMVDVEGGSWYNTPVQPHVNVCRKWLFGKAAAEEKAQAAEEKKKQAASS